ncbi:MAG: hypothetical protein Q8L01_03940 [Candidatus Woesebacteria bacterium]|nr:hypothetical protein [Candidatus Woesebacteria bacterium]
MDGILTLSSKNQLTLPVSMVSFLGLDKGAKLWTKIVNNMIVMEKVNNSWDSLQGTLKDTTLTKGKSVLEIIEIARDIEGKRLAKKHGL